MVEGVDLTGVKLFVDEKSKDEPAGEAAADPVVEGEDAAGEEGELGAAAPAAVKPKVAEKPNSASFLAMARLEKQNREFKQELEKLRAGAKPVDLTEENFWDLAAERGIDAQKLVNRLVDRKEPPKPKTAAEIETERLKKDVEELRQREKARDDEKAAERARAGEASAKEELKRVMGEKTEELPFVNAYAEDATDTIWAAMVEHYKKTGDALDPLEQAHKLEEFYKAKHEKAQAALTPKNAKGTIPSSSRSPQQTGSGRPPAAGPRNLTNRATAATSPTRNTPLTEDERIEEATKALKYRQD